ncbi:hypothetical protein PHSY_001118 [Pseudozyma hubeiensis SY62]|uniref:Ubiquitin-like domain-containing protein n=1 Tax=Pseudozyma hubeiensis (strain SY62) TaxID=1305764 RepID=R9NXT7_PSEHS|nr:hypothetical protein PHSY_001118 [Pseudozyma hubeiensis SY62]GAC93553.1 hypothetical protein PHSY_001118 [Pseudozyma hubeiensis SY62]
MDYIPRDPGPGSSSSSLQASVRVRPVTIRFTEPGVSDLHLNLHSIESLRPIAPRSLVDTSQPQDRDQQQLIFDFDVEDQPTNTNAPAAISSDDEDQLVHQVVESLRRDGLMGDETVQMLKAKMEKSREGVRGRRLRLIHAGRILRDRVRLVEYLEEMDLRTRVQGRQSLRHLALPDGRRGEKEGVGDASEEEGRVSEMETDDGSAGDEEGERDTVQKKEMSVRDMVEWLVVQNSEVIKGDTGAGSSTAQNADFSMTKGKGKNREPSFYSDSIRLTIRTAPTVYIQCSVGELDTHTSLASPTDTRSDPLIDLDPASTDAPLDVDTDPASRNRGFNRLLDAGLTAAEISTIRDQFRTSHPLSTTYDLIQAREHAQHLLEMEESWMDTFSATTTTNNPTLGDFGDPAPTSGAYTTVMQGLMVGFFLPPLIPLFWFRDKPHPSSLPNQVAAEEEDEEDDEQQWEMERLTETSQSVFGSTMQVSILFGLVANLTIGLFRFIW